MSLRWLTWVGSQIPTASTLTGAETLPVVQSGATNRTTLQSIADWVVQSAASFVPSGTGATSESLQTRGRRIVYITDYGGVCDSGTTDNGAALQKAHDALGADGGQIILPPTAGYYGITTQAAFTKDVELVGVGQHCSEFGSSTASLTWITHTAKLIVRNCGFTALGAAIGSCTFVKTLSSATNHGDSGLFGCFMSNAMKGWWSQRTNKLQVHFNTISCTYGLYLENLTSSDEGDSFSSNNTYSCTTSAVLILSTSGWRSVNDKYNSSCTVHLDIAATSNLVGDFSVSNASMEGHTTAAIRLIATSGTITKTSLSNVQCSSSGATHLIIGNGATNTTVGGGSIFNDLSAAAGVGIDIKAGASNVNIGDVSFHQILTAIQSTTDIVGITITEEARFASDVTNFFSGEDTALVVGTAPSSKTLVFTRFLNVSSNAVYTNAVQFKGQCRAEVTVDGVVQGAGNGTKYRLVSIAGAAVTNIIAEVPTGSTFDMQVIDGGSGYTLAGIKRNGATGTSVTAYMTVKLTGFPTAFSKV